MKRLNKFMLSYGGYISLSLCWIQLTYFIFSAIDLFIKWNLFDNLRAILSIAICYLCDFVFTLKDARAMNAEGNDLINSQRRQGE